MHQTRYHTSWRISRPTTIEPEPQPDMVPTGEVRAAISMRFTSPTSRKHAYFGTSDQFVYDPNGYKSFTLSAGSVTGGTSLTGTLTLIYPAPPGGYLPIIGGTTSNLWVSQPPNFSAVTLPTVSFTGGSTTVSFTISTSPVSSAQLVTISAMFFVPITASFYIEP